MAQGFAFGTGSSIARGAVGAAGRLFGGSSEQAAQPAAQQAAAAPAAQDVAPSTNAPSTVLGDLERHAGGAISASVVEIHRRHCPSHDDVGGFFFEAVRSRRCSDHRALSMCQENAKWQSA